jgi:hypothetical protein
MHVVLEPASLDALADFLASRIARASQGSSIDPSDLSIAIKRHRVEIELHPEDGRFFLSAIAKFIVHRDDPHLAGLGVYAFYLSGDMQEPADEPVGPLQVLLLGDGGSETQVETALVNAGYEVTTIPRYVDWDGVAPNVADFDVVIYLDGKEFGMGLVPAADAALADFVAAGGGLVRTEWSVWAGLVNPLTDPLLPLTYAGFYRYGTSRATDWTVVLPGHPLAAGVDPVWRDLGDYSLATPDATATVVVETDDGWPLVTTGSDAGGTVVHINHALTYRGFNLDPNVLQLFVNAAAFAGGR